MNSYNWHSRCPNYQMTAFVFFILMSTREGEGWFEGASTWLIHYKKSTKNADSHPSVLLKVPSNSVLRLYSFDSGYSLVVWGEGGGGIRRIRYYNFFPKHSFLFSYYHKMNLHYRFIISKILVYIFNSFFLQILEIH